MPQDTESAAAPVEQSDLAGAAVAVETAGAVVGEAFKQLGAAGDVGADQVIAYDLSS